MVDMSIISQNNTDGHMNAQVKCEYRKNADI